MALIAIVDLVAKVAVGLMAVISTTKLVSREEAARDVGWPQRMAA